MPEKIFKILIFLLLVLTYCDKRDNTDYNIFDYSYFPFDTGIWYVYEIEQIVVDKPMNVYDTIKYEIKEVYESFFYDNSGRQAIRIERYIKEKASSNWEIKDIWYANLLTKSAQKVEENIRYVKLVFPVELYKTWDGNAYNTFEEEIYKITNIDTPESINKIFFDSVLTVTQYDNETVIDKYYKIEKYAKHVGMIFKQIIDVYSDSIVPGVPVEHRITRGTLYTQKILDYWNN